MDTKDATAMAYQLRELKEATRAAKLTQRKSNFKAVVTVHKAAGAKWMVGYFMFFFVVFSVGFFFGRVC